MGVMANMTITSKEGHHLVTFHPGVHLNLAELTNIWRLGNKEGERTMVIDGGSVELRYLFDTKSFNWAEQRVIV